MTNNTTRHQHIETRDAAGRRICMSCSQVIIDPILSTTDPRLRVEYPPLPFLLVSLFQQSGAPIAPYVEDVAFAHRPSDQIEWEMIFDVAAGFVDAQT